MSGLFGKKGQAQVDQRLNAIQINQSAYGNPMPLVYGKTRVPSNLGWYGSFVATPHTQKLGGGKGGGGGNSTTSFTYSAALILMLCEGPITGIGTVWADKAQKTLSDLGFTFFSGAGGQAVWSFLTTNAPSQAIPYDHTTYVANGSFDLGGNAALPNLTFELKALKPFNAGTIDDAEITDIIVDYLLDPNHGAQFNYLGGIQGGGATTLQTYCMANGFFISPAETTQRSAVEFLREMLMIANAEACWSSGFLNMVPFGTEAITGNGRTFTPNLTPLYTFTDDDYCPEEGTDPVVTNRKAASQTFNRVRVEYLNRANQYNVDIAEATDANDIALNGERAMPTVTLHSITTLTVARLVAQLILQRQLYVRNSFDFKVRADYSLLEPMDLVAINDSSQGIVNQLVRILETTDDEEDGFAIVAEEVPVGPAAAPVYNWQAAAGYAANYFGAPGSVSTPLIFALPTLLSGVNGGYELAIAVSGAGGLWGGCDVYMSLDNTSYVYIGTIAGPARYGTLRSTFASHADPDDTNTLQLLLANTTLALTSGTTADEDNLRTLMYVDGEIMSYRTATLVGTGQYDLTHLRRGKYGSTIGAHTSGTKWARIDSGLFRLPYDPGMLGQTVYFKFPSFNFYGQAHETLAGAAAYSYVLANANAGQNLPGNATFVARGNCAIVGDKLFKASGVNAWDSDIYSIEKYSAGCEARFRAGQTTLDFMIGLNTDPTLDQNFTSIDFAWFCDSSAGLTIYESGSAKGSFGFYTTSTVLSITYDGYLVRYFIDGVLQRAITAPGLTLALDSSFNKPGAAAVDVFFGQLQSATPSLYIARGNCIVSDDNVHKQGGSSAWDSDFFSIVGYPVCNLGFKANDSTSDLMVGLNSDPSSDQSYTSLDYAWRCGSGTPAIWESGVSIATYAAYTPSTVFAITYDGTTVTYWKDGVSQRTVTDAGKTFFADSSFNTPGGGINSLRFGPTANLPVVDTPQIGANAATVPYSLTVAGPNTYNAGTLPGGPTYYGSISGTGIDALSLLQATVTADIIQTVAGAQAQIWMILDWGAGNQSSDVCDVNLVGTKITVTVQRRFTALPANTAWTLTVRLSCSGSASFTISHTTVHAEALLR